MKYSGGISVLSHKPQGLKTFIPKSGDLVPSVFVPGAVPTQRWGTFARATRTRSSWGSSTILFHEPQRSSTEPSNQATKKSNSRVRLPPPGESCSFFAMMLAFKKYERPHPRLWQWSCDQDQLVPGRGKMGRESVVDLWSESMRVDVSTVSPD